MRLTGSALAFALAACAGAPDDKGASPGESGAADGPGSGDTAHADDTTVVGTDSGGTDGTGTDTGGTDSGSPPSRFGFAEAGLAYALPDELAAYNARWLPLPGVTLEAPCGSGGTYHYALSELTGDGRPDLVLYRDDCSDADIGRAYWRVYPAGDTGFEAGAPFHLPESVADHDPAGPSFAGSAVIADCPTGRYGFILSDLTGDGRLDYVLQTDSCLSPTLGHGVWWVYPGDGAGFSDTAIPYTLPAAVSDHGSDYLGFFGTGGDMDCDLAGGEAAWTLLDLSADGLLDLVFHYDDCIDSDMGVTYWDVYRGTPTGFEELPLSWSLPVGFEGHAPGTVPWFGTSGFGECDPTRGLNYSFTVMELSGDDVLDLVLHYDDCVGPDGGSQWEVYAGDTSGFAAVGVSFTLPSALERYGDPAFPTTQGFGDCDGGERYSYETLDMTADGFPDLVVHVDECGDPDLGALRWDVYPGSPSGFADTPLAFALPSVSASYNTDFHPLYGPPSADGAQGDCDETGEHFYGWSILDMNADARPDLLFTFDQCRAGDIGEAAWALHIGQPGEE